jgi:hypothetical protein
MLERRPSDRFQSAKEVLNALMSSSKTEVSQGSGLPPTQLSPDNQNPSWKTIALIVAPILLLVVGVVALESPRIGFLCGALNNCLADKPFNESYNSAVKQAGDARVLGQNAQTAQELQTARDRMKSAIDQLSSIPSTAKVHADTQKLLPSYQSELTAMEAHLTREQQAQKQLEEALAIAADAPKETDLSKKKAAWIQAADKLKAISSDSFVADKVKTLLAECDRQIKDIETSIPQPAPSPQPPSPEATPTPADDLFKLSPESRDRAPAPEPSPSVPNAPTPKDDKPLF